MGISIAPLISHQQHLVGRSAQGGVIVALIEQAALGGGGLRGQSHDDGQPQGVEGLGQIPDKGCVSPGVLREHELKVHIQSPVALGLDGGHQVVNEPALNVGVVEHQAGQLIGEAALLGQGGQVHQRGHAALLRHSDQLRIVQIYQAAVFCDTVGEGSHVRQVGEGGAQQRPVDKGIGIAVDGKGPLFFLPVGDDQSLPGVNGLAAAQDRIVALKLPHGQTILLCDRRKSLTGLHRMHLLWEAYYNSLPHDQS